MSDLGNVPIASHAPRVPFRPRDLAQGVGQAAAQGEAVVRGGVAQLRRTTVARVSAGLACSR